MKYIVEVTESNTNWKDFETGRIHRLDGPAVEWTNGGKEYSIDGKRYTKEQFDTKVNSLNKKELTISEIEDKLGYSIKIIKGKYPSLSL